MVTTSKNPGTNLTETLSKHLYICSSSHDLIPLISLLLTKFYVRKKLYTSGICEDRMS